ncbi:MAG: family 43 glycosylhydrolase [Pseudoalteromonas sp.]|uniref:LamG-like jellyroll fold domain-containing protein n=1 Tax=Pseudoalteromonas TaxID=53246 RepID=UPI00110ABB4A|nr:MULTISPECIES: LamG-like jellyroll fold domain-containing protein [unclassified Pseudoalteromonas]MCH2088150.1 family 43 glycosylhydrolase [Pseudoalteromonas sp.]TMP14854.1 beta-xylosidase [Pseudoalteromonas sp. S2721]
MKLNKLAMVIACSLAVTGCGKEDGTKLDTAPAVADPQSAKPTVSSSVEYTESGSVMVTNVSVHDPSVVKVDDTYYIFGSHLAAAKSTDLLNWEMVSSPSVVKVDGQDVLQVNESPLFDYNYLAEIAEGVEWTDGYPSNWAADVIQSPNGKFWFYYNSCGQDNTKTTDITNDQICWDRGYLGLAEADNIEGPYTNKGIFLRSGYRNEAEFAAYPLDNGQTTYDGGIDPNVIDPAAFYDTDGKLWMVYGSHHGGIFILAMDEEAGMPEAGQGYGKHLLGGAGRFIEGAFVMYSPESEYYYLFYSTGGLDLNGGYNIRVARSKTPDGPYLDNAGNDISTLGGLEVGEKLMGGFEYTQELGETAPAWGYQSPGHNSAYYDEATGRHLLITHTRFPQTSTEFPENTEAHQVRVHEMFINSLGWPMASPQRYVPLEGDNMVVADELYGYYKFINHGTDVNTDAIRSMHIALNEDHSVTGDDPGIWYMIDDSNIKLELDSGTYFGVAKWQWDDATKTMVVTVSATSSEGATIWASKRDEITATTNVLSTVQEALDIKTELSIADEGYSLPTKGKDGAVINWESSDEYYITSEGSVFIPTPDRGDKAVTLTANISLNGESTTKTFNVNLEARPEFKNAIAHYAFEDSLSDSLDNLDDAGVTDNNLLNVGAGTAAYAEGQTGKAFNFDGATGVRLPDEIINSDSFTVSFWSKPDTLNPYTPLFFAAENVNRWISYIPAGAAHFTENPLIWSFYLGDNGEELWNQIVHTQKATLSAWTHVAISYDEGVMNYYSNGVLVGSMPRPDMFSHESSNFALGVNYGWDLPFQGQIDEFIVYDYALNSFNINAAAMTNQTNPDNFPAFIKSALDLGDVSAVRDNFELPRVGPFVSGISWTSNNEEYLKPVNGTAVVTQPSASAGDQVVTLTATIKYKDFTDTKSFDVTLKSLAPAEYSFEGDLSALNGAYAAGKSTGGFINNTGGSVSYVDGVIGQAVFLEGSGVRLPDNLITTNDYSVSMWLKPESFTDYTTAFFAGASANAWLSYVPSMADTALTRLWANNGAFFDNAELDSRIPAKEWTHVAFTVDGTNGDVLKMYVNGELQLEADGFPRVFTVPGETNEFALGVNYWDTPYHGAIDELKIFNGAISAEEIKALFDAAPAQE